MADSAVISQADGALGHTMVVPLTQYLSFPRTPAMIGCSFVVDREYFRDIGLLDPGMEVYGAENIELGMRVSGCRAARLWGAKTTYKGGPEAPSCLEGFVSPAKTTAQWEFLPALLKVKLCL